MHKERPRGRLASKYHRGLAHWDARPMARDWSPRIVGSKRVVCHCAWQSTGPSFLGLGNGWGKLVERMQRENTSRQAVQVLTIVIGEDAGVVRYRVSNLCTVRPFNRQTACVPHWPGCRPNSRSSKRDEGLMPCSKSEACDAARACQRA